MWRACIPATSRSGARWPNRRGRSTAGIPYDVTPGVPAFAASAALLECELTVPEVAQSLVLTRTSGRASAMPESELLAAFARTGATLAIHLSIHVLGKLVQDLTPILGADCPVAIVFRASWPDEKSCGEPSPTSRRASLKARSSAPLWCWSARRSGWKIFAKARSTIPIISAATGPSAAAPNEPARPADRRAALGQRQDHAALGLLRALRDSGVRVAASRSGPTTSTAPFTPPPPGAPSVNLDSWAMARRSIAALAATAAEGATC